MDSKLTHLQDNLYSITFMIPAQEATTAYNTAASRIAQYVNI